MENLKNKLKEIQRDQNAAKNLKDNALRILVDDLKSTLLLEQEEVMSMEGMEVNLSNGMIYGVFYEVESEESDPSHEAVCFS